MVILKKIYKIVYGSKFKFVLSQLITIIVDFIIIIAGFIPTGFLLGWIFSYNKISDFIQKMLACLVSVPLLILFSVLVVSFFIPKKLIIDDNCLFIKRYNINLDQLFRGLNDTILISEIAYCDIYEREDHMPQKWGLCSVYFFDYNNLVEIRLKNNKRYFVPLQNPDEFIIDINQRIQ